MDFTPDNTIDELTANKIVREALMESIQSHFLSDVPVGIFLSGGIDSSAILALARQTQTTNISTYSIAFEESQFDEGSVARKTAQYFETDHHEEIITAASAKILFSQYLKSLDQPSVDGLNTFSVSKLASQDNKKVVLSGLGGDELFAGYSSFNIIPKMIRYRSQLKSLDPLFKTVILGVSSLTENPKLKRLEDFFAVNATTTGAYQSMRGIFAQREAELLVRLYCPDFNKLNKPNFIQIVPPPKFPSIGDEVSYLEISRYMRNQLLRDSDVMSMRFGLELRVPFVDKKFLETLLKIPSKYRLSLGKKILIESVPEIPKWVINRPKQGFSFPFQQWLGEDWLEDLFYFKEIPKQISLTIWYRKWLIIVLNYWLQSICL
jgi:asparagine synthase (glutamine-hydrolysing)